MQILGTSIDSVTVEPGATVRLNTAKNPMLGVTGFALSLRDPVRQVPMDISDASLAQLRRAHDAGLISIGAMELNTEPVPDPVSQTTPEKLIAALEASSSPKDLSAPLAKILQQDRTASLAGREPKIIFSQEIRALIEYEASNECRDEYINWLTQVLHKHGGISEVTHETELVVQPHEPSGSKAMGGSEAEDLF